MGRRRGRVHTFPPRLVKTVQLRQRDLQRLPVPRARHDRLHVPHLQEASERRLRERPLELVEAHAGD
jgi:hypothetical protein